MTDFNSRIQYIRIQNLNPFISNGKELNSTVQKFILILSPIITINSDIFLVGEDSSKTFFLVKRKPQKTEEDLS